MTRLCGMRPPRLWARVLGLALVLLADAFVLPAGAIPEAPSISPPVMRETFTPLPCPADPIARRTTIGSLGCAEQRILRSDARINKRVRTIFAELSDATAKRRFVAAE